MLSLCTGQRLAKNIFKETDVMIQRYNDALDSLMQQLRDGFPRDILSNVHCMGKSWSQITLNLR